MARFWLAFFIINLVLTAAALISCLSAEEGQIKALPRIAWVIIILLFSPIGAIAFFIAGREHAPRPQTWPQGTGFPEAQRPRRDHRPVAPDDDPEFLRQLSKQQAEDRELMIKWEADLKRREEELRKSDTPEE
jgi:hypothetical protein